MLTKSVLDGIQQTAGLATFTTSASKAGLTANNAANAKSFNQHAAMVRRNRRMRRAERNEARSSIGWTVRMW